MASLSIPKTPYKPCCTASYVQANGATYTMSVSAEVQHKHFYVLWDHVTETQQWNRWEERDTNLQPPVSLEDEIAGGTEKYANCYERLP